MKIVDERGKLFGFINVIDFIVLSLIVALLGGFTYYVYDKKVNNPDIDSAGQDEVYITVKCRMIAEEAPLGLNVGDKLVARNLFTTAEIVSINYTDADYTAPDSSGYLVLSTHPIWKDAVVVVKDKVNRNSPILRVGNQEARIGFQYNIKTQTVEMVGSTIAIEFKQ